MEALVKFTEENLSEKNEVQLRQILRKEFAFIKGTSLMNKAALISKILEKRNERLQEIDSNHGLDMNVIHKDLQGNEWMIDDVEKGIVYIQNSTGHKTNVTLDAFGRLFHETKYCQFTEGSQVGELTQDDSEEEAVQDQSDDQQEVESETKQQDQPSTPPVTDLNKKLDPLTMSKSDLVRAIIKRQYANSPKVTSGTVMKQLKDDYSVEIHRSFASTLLAQYRKNHEIK